RIGDGPVQSAAIALEAGESRSVPAVDGLRYAIEVSPREDRVLVVLRLIDAEGEPLHRAQIFRLDAADVQLRVGFVVCGDRLILQDPAPGDLARCADLPPLARLDPNPTDCIECVGAYEGMPQSIAA